MLLIKTKEFDLFHPESKFTDDTTLSMAIAKSILDDELYLGNGSAMRVSPIAFAYESE